MASTFDERPSARQRVVPEIDRHPVKANLRNPEAPYFRVAIGKAIQRAADLCGWNLEQLAQAVERDPRQVRRWIDGSERPQFDTLFSVPVLRQPLVIAIAELAGQGVEIETIVRVKRIA